MSTVNIQITQQTIREVTGRYYVDAILEDLTNPETQSVSVEIQVNATQAEVDAALDAQATTFANRATWQTLIDANAGTPRTLAVVISDPES